ncbi:MAG: hypothetical protein K9M96_11175 [Deltaproteobacteria bacterium]|nr:hypothetical protein [Deltaproteobacteria bacterium]MCF8119077.1 hypothetical protein [Deltaproteobacteria bacterium]
MDLFRKIGIGIASIIPAFVLGGLVWDMFGSWLAVIGMEVVMVVFYIRIISEKHPSGQGA